MFRRGATLFSLSFSFIYHVFLHDFRELSVSSHLRSGVTISCCDRRPHQALLSSPLQQVSTGLLDKTWTFSGKKKRFEQLLNLKWTSWFGSEPLQWKQSEDLWRCEVYWHTTAQRHLDLLTLRTLTLSCETFVWFYCLGNWTWKGDDSKMFIYINRNVEIYQIDVTLVIWSEQRDTRLYSCLWLGKKERKMSYLGSQFNVSPYVLWKTSCDNVASSEIKSKWWWISQWYMFHILEAKKKWNY